MKVIVKDWRDKPREMEDWIFFQPSDLWNDGGIAERASANARAANEALGRLIAFLYEKRIVTIEEACKIAGVSLENWLGEVCENPPPSGEPPV